MLTARFEGKDEESVSLITDKCLAYGENTNDDYVIVEEHPIPDKGLNLLSALFFVIGTVLGAGIVAVPFTMKLASWITIPLLLVAAVVVALCGVLLVKAVNEKVIDTEEEGTVTRDPYPVLAENAVGRKSRILVIIVMNVTVVMVCLVLLLLAGEILSRMIPVKVVDSSYRNQLRVWFVIAGGFLYPFTLFGSPKEFWGIALTATVTSLISVVMIFACLAMVKAHDIVKPIYESPKAKNVFASFGTLVLAFGGSSIFPNVQDDMKEPHKFGKVVVGGFTIIGLVYLLVSVLSYAILGELIGEDLLSTLESLSIYKEDKVYRALLTIAQLLICGHALSAYVLTINIMHLQVEASLRIPLDFCWQRVSVRTFSLIVIVAIAILIPDFGPVLSLLGGTFQMTLCIVFPIWFYLTLEGKTKLITKVCLCIVAALAIVAGIGNFIVEIGNVIEVIEGKYKPGSR